MVLKVKDINENEHRSQKQKDSFYELKMRQHVVALSGLKHKDKEKGETQAEHCKTDIAAHEQQTGKNHEKKWGKEASGPCFHRLQAHFHCVCIRELGGNKYGWGYWRGNKDQG